MAEFKFDPQPEKLVIHVNMDKPLDSQMYRVASEDVKAIEQLSKDTGIPRYRLTHALLQFALERVQIVDTAEL